MAISEERFIEVFNLAEKHLEDRYELPVVISDVPNPFTGDLDGVVGLRRVEQRVHEGDQLHDEEHQLHDQHEGRLGLEHVQRAGAAARGEVVADVVDAFVGRGLKKGAAVVVEGGEVVREIPAP